MELSTTKFSTNFAISNLVGLQTIVGFPFELMLGLVGLECFRELVVFQLSIWPLIVVRIIQILNM